MMLEKRYTNRKQPASFFFYRRDLVDESETMTIVRMYDITSVVLFLPETRLFKDICELSEFALTYTEFNN